MPALPTYLIEPIREQFIALLPERKVEHPLGCHRARISDRVIFEKLVAVLVFGCAYWRIADGSCSATTLRRRRDEWIDAGVMDTLRKVALDAYDRTIGLELDDVVAVDCCITKAPCGAEMAGTSPVDRGKQGTKRSTHGRRRLWHPTRSHSCPGQPSRLSAVGRDPGHFRDPRATARADECTPRPRLRLQSHKREAQGPRLDRRDLRERQAGPTGGHETLGSRAHELPEQRPQEAPLVYRAPGSGDRLLDRLLGGCHRREEAHPTRLDPLPLGGPTLSPTVAYWRKL